MFEFFPLLIAIVAFIFARKAFNQAAMLRARLDAIEATGLQASPGPPPSEAPEQPTATSSPGIAAEQPATVADAELVAPVADDKTAPPTDTVGGATATPPPLPDRKSVV